MATLKTEELRTSLTVMNEELTLIQGDPDYPEYGPVTHAQMAHLVPEQHRSNFSLGLRENGVIWLAWGSKHPTWREAIEQAMQR